MLNEKGNNRSCKYKASGNFEERKARLKKELLFKILLMVPIFIFVFLQFVPPFRTIYIATPSWFIFLVFITLVALIAAAFTKLFPYHSIQPRELRLDENIIAIAHSNGWGIGLSFVYFFRINYTLTNQRLIIERRGTNPRIYWFELNEICDISAPQSISIYSKLNNSKYIDIHFIPNSERYSIYKRMFLFTSSKDTYQLSLYEGEADSFYQALKKAIKNCATR